VPETETETEIEIAPETATSTEAVPPPPIALGRLAELVRSKNAGPFWITFDIFLATDEDYRRAAAPGVVTEHAVAELYHVDPAVVRIYRMPDLRVVKVSFPRPTPQGDFHDRDMHAGQQHIPLAALPVA
jgi:hypothetical protein